jgi:hypothetical protein
MTPVVDASRGWRSYFSRQRYRPYVRTSRLALPQLMRGVQYHASPHGDFWTDGYLWAKRVFTANEIEQLRRRVVERADWQGDLLSHPFLRSVVLDERILKIARQLLGARLVYFGDSSFSVGPQSRGYHKDNPDRLDGNGPDWRDRYTVIRFGLYLQDHSRHSGGLNIRLASHNKVSDSEGANLYLGTEIGDLTAWSLRTTHSGNGVLMKRLHWLPVEPAFISEIPAGVLEPVERDRIGVFVTVGVDDHHLTRYVEYLKTRAYAVAGWRHSDYGSEVWDAVRGKDLIVRDMKKVIESTPAVGLHENHVQIPY